MHSELGVPPTFLWSMFIMKLSTLDQKEIMFFSVFSFGPKKGNFLHDGILFLCKLCNHRWMALITEDSKCTLWWGILHTVRLDEWNHNGLFHYWSVQCADLWKIKWWNKWKFKVLFISPNQIPAVILLMKGRKCLLVSFGNAFITRSTMYNVYLNGSTFYSVMFNDNFNWNCEK